MKEEYRKDFYMEQAMKMKELCNELCDYYLKAHKDFDIDFNTHVTIFSICAMLLCNKEQFTREYILFDMNKTVNKLWFNIEKLKMN